MEQSKDQATLDELRPMSVTNENLKIYASLKQCMRNNEELRQALVTAAETITRQTELIEHLHRVLKNASDIAKHNQ